MAETVLSPVEIERMLQRGLLFLRGVSTLAPVALQLQTRGYNLTAARGGMSVVAVSTFLERSAKLRDGTDPKRQATRERDRSAIARLAERGILTPEIEALLREKIATVTSAPVSLPAAPDPELTAEYQATVARFRAWLTEWREIARVLITRRDWLIRLGLAARRKAATSPSEEEQ